MKKYNYWYGDNLFDIDFKVNTEFGLDNKIAEAIGQAAGQYLFIFNFG